MLFRKKKEAVQAVQEENAVPTPVAVAPKEEVPTPVAVAPKEEVQGAPDASSGFTDAAATLAQIRSALNGADSDAAPVPGEAPETEETAEVKEREQDRSLYKSLLAGLYDAILILDHRGTTIGSNGRAESFFGYNVAELWSKPCTELIAAITPRVLNKIQMHAESGRFTVVSAACTRKDGTTFPAEIAISKIDLLHEGDLILSIRNQERRARAKTIHDLQQDALSCAGAGIAVCGIDGMIEMINPALTKLLQLERSGDACKRFIGDFCTSHDAASAVMRAPSVQGNWLGEMEIVTAKGIVRRVLATAALSEKQKHIVLTLTPIPTKLTAE